MQFSIYFSCVCGSVFAFLFKVARSIVTQLSLLIFEEALHNMERS
jgi:hypothetical protein